MLVFPLRRALAEDYLRLRTDRRRIAVGEMIKAYQKNVETLRISTKAARSRTTRRPPESPPFGSGSIA